MAVISHHEPVYAQNPSSGTDGEVTCMAECPLDGSMWMGTANNGLYRLSKTGSRLHFSATSGKLGSDSILYICFDSASKLWILEAEGYLTSYTAKEGFRTKQLENDQISGAIYLPKRNRLMLSSVTKLFTFNPVTESIESESEIAFEPVNLKLSSDSSFVWIFGEKKVARLADDGSVIEWTGVGDISNLLPLEFETYTEQDTPRANVWLIIAICLVLAFTTIIIILLRKRRTPAAPKIDPLYEGIQDTSAATSTPTPEPTPEPEIRLEIKPEPVVEKPKTKPAPVTKSSVFTTRVMMLIEEHYKEPDFDVDAIAALTGLSRIHVNRKLKAEGAPSPSALIRDRRMEVAKFYLLQGDIPMAKIASECGFRSPSYFTTAFKEYTGLTPSEFATKNRL